MISGATYREGVAYNSDGAMYVTPASGSSWVAANGTAGAPSIAFTGSPTTGFSYSTSPAYTVGLSMTGSVQYSWSGTGYTLGSGTAFGWGNSTTFNGGILADVTLTRAGTNAIQFGQTNATTTSRTEINKAVSSIANAVATATFTITVPNAAHSASILVRVTGSLGAGGAIGANEATASNSYVITITRTAGVNAVAAISSAFGAAASNVAGATTVTCTAAMSAVSGAVGATNTFTVDVTISRGGGSSTNHTCLCYAQLMNSNASGITIS